MRGIVSWSPEGARRETLLRSGRWRLRPAPVTLPDSARIAVGRRPERDASPLPRVIGVLAVVTLALTAFDNESSRPREPARAAAGDLGAAGSARARDRREPARAVARRAGRRDGDRVPRKRRRRARPQARRPAANEGLLARLWRRITGASRSGLAWYQLSGGPLRTLDVGAVAGTDVYSPVDGTVVAIRDQVVSGTHGRRRDRAAALLGAVARRVDPERAAGSRALRGRERRRRARRSSAP